MNTISFSKTLLITGIAAATFFLAPISAFAIEYGGVGGKPAFPRADNPRTQSIFIHSLEPGEAVEEGVIVVNNTGETKTILVYASDSTPSSGGAFACKQLAEPKTDVGNWITLSQSEVTLEPGTNQTIPFSILVPENAGTGEHNGCILIQEKKEKVEGQSGASLSVRTGLRVALTVPGEIVRNLEIDSFSISSSKTGRILHTNVKNTGNVSIDATTTVTTKYFFGVTHSSDDGQYPILRGETSQWNFDLERPFWGGLYFSSFTVEYDKNDTLSKLTSDSVWFFSFPAPLALLIEVVVLLLIIFGIKLIRRAKHEKIITITRPAREVKPRKKPKTRKRK